MTCTIRNLKRSPAGRESIRERDFEGTEITIGRDAQCDVRFQDLSVALYHARLSYDPEGQVFLHIQDGQRVSVDNRIQTGTAGPLPIGRLSDGHNTAATAAAMTKKIAMLMRPDVGGNTFSALMNGLPSSAEAPPDSVCRRSFCIADSGFSSCGSLASVSVLAMGSAGFSASVHSMSAAALWCAGE